MSAPTLVVENGVLVTMDGDRVVQGWLGIAGDRIVALAEGAAPPPHPGPGGSTRGAGTSGRAS